MSEMGKIRFGVHEIKGHSISLPRNCPTEIFAQGGQSDIYRNVQYSIAHKKKIWKQLMSKNKEMFK